MVILALWFVLVAFVTLTPQSPAHLSGAGSARRFFCVACGSRGVADAVLNIVLFMPLGALLPRRRFGLLRVAGVALLLSLSIEMAQLRIPGRDSSFGDVLTNTGGAWIGAAVWALRPRWLRGSARDAAVLRGLAVAMVFVVTFGFGWLMKPDWPVARYWGQWTPDLGSMKHYRGRVLRARLDSIPIVSRRLTDSPAVRRELQGDWIIDVVVVKGSPPPGLAPILSIYDGKQREVLLLGADHEDLVYSERSVGQRVKLDEPALRYRGILAEAAVGDTVRLEIVRRDGHRCLGVDGLQHCPSFTPGRAWALLYPVDSTDPWLPGSLNVLWMFLLFFPVGFWSRRPRALAVSGLVAGLAMGLGVVLTRLGRPPMSELVGALAGLLMGSAIGVAVAIVERRKIQSLPSDPPPCP